MWNGNVNPVPYQVPGQQPQHGTQPMFTQNFPGQQSFQQPYNGQQTGTPQMSPQFQRPPVNYQPQAQQPPMKAPPPVAPNVGSFQPSGYPQQQQQYSSPPPMVQNAPLPPQSFLQNQNTNMPPQFQQPEPIQKVPPAQSGFPPAQPYNGNTASPFQQPAMPQRYPTQAMPPQHQYNGPATSTQPVAPPPPAPQYQQQQQRLDPDAMPSVVQVIEDDKAKYSTGSNIIFSTSIPTAVPPLITSLKQDGTTIIQDGGSARPLHVRSTIYQVPTSEDILKTTGIPLGLVIEPFDESEVDGHMSIPITDSEILRCNRCKAYMNPLMRFVDGGRRFQCSLCHHVSEVSQTYFSHLDHTGQRLDKYERPELYLGSYEFKATAEYCRNSILNCRRPHIVFAFELSINSKPVIQQISKQLPDIIRNHIPRDTLRPGSLPPLVGFMTYNSKIQMYDIVNNGQAYIICDVNNTFPPFTSFLVDPDEYADQIESFLVSLSNMNFGEELETETVLGPVIDAAFQTCHVDNSNWFKTENDENSNTQKNQAEVISSGKVYLFHCTLPTFGQDGITPGRLKPRWTTTADEIRKILGTDKEKQILTPESSKYYNNLAQRCVTEYGSGVELFLFPPVTGPYLDIATLSELVRLTGSGALYKYFNDSSDRFVSDLKFSLKSSFAFDATMKVRTSAGIRPVEYVGNYYARTTTDIECSVINAGNNVAVEIKYDDKLPEDEFAVIQVATLYTSLSGERRVRIHNLAFSVCQQVADVYRSACCDTLMNLMLRQGINSLRSGEKTIQQVKEALITRGVTILAAYRRHCAQPGQLILPEALKLLPMYITGALKCDAIDGGPEMLPDDKAYAQIKTLGANVSMTHVILYPKLLKIEYDTNDETSLSITHNRCAAHRLSNGLAFILENGFYLFLFLPNTTDPKQSKFIKNVFGVDSFHQIQPELGLPQLLTAESQVLNGLFEEIYMEKRKRLRVYVVRQGLDKLENVFRSFLYEDTKTRPGISPSESNKFEVPSYVDLLCHLHKEIRTQLN